MQRALVTGAGGFIGHHLVTRLRCEGYWVRGADRKRPEFRESEADELLLLDLRDPDAALAACDGVDEVYALAADMGGMGYISSHHARILHGNSLIDLNTLDAARARGVSRLFYASSACVYPEHLQSESDVTALAETDAYPAQPQDAYGWEKLMAERLCLHYREDFALETRVARFHNVFGPYGTFDGGREKAPAAICRKVAQAKLSGRHEVEIWGDGKQTRSFCYVDDCLTGIRKLMASDHAEPLNLGQDRLISIDGLVDLVAGIAEISVRKTYVEGPQGVRGRNSDNTRARQVLDWAPIVSLEEGLARTYGWIEDQLRRSGAR